MAAHHATHDPELRAALDRLFSLQTFGIKLGLDNIKTLLAEVGDPHLRLRTVHVAGTNGKGSVCALVASTLMAAGLRVGLYTSPHLLDFSERIRVDGKPIDEERLARYAREMMPVIERLGCTFFEGTTAMGFRYFAEEGVDVAVIETGMGGRLDATNVLTPLVSVVTSIGLDHTKHLGDTLEKIAFEKAGIIKSGVPAVVGHVAPRLRELFTQVGEDVRAPVLFADDLCHSLYHETTFEHTIASFIVEGRELPRLAIGLPGRYQIDNASVALTTIEQLRNHFAIDEEAIRSGFASVRSTSGIRGRFERVGRDPVVVLDVAHNPDGARVLFDTLRSLGVAERSVRFVYGAVEDKDVSAIVSILAPFARHLYAVRADNHRSLPADEIEARAIDAGVETSLDRSVSAGIDHAMRDVGAAEIIVVCGSFYVVEEAIRAIDPRYHEPDAAGVIGEPRSRAKEKSRGEDEGMPRLSVKEWSPSDQPRERLMKLGPQALSNAELLAIILRTGTQKEDVIQMSRTLLRRFDDSLLELSSRDYRELQTIAGIGPTKAVTLAAAFELATRIQFDPFVSRPRIEGPEDVARLYVPRLRGVRKEQFHVLILNSANQVVRTEMISEGNLNSSIVHPREVFRTAIVERAAAIIGLHNHPSGNPTPSKEDIAITRQLAEAGRIVGIPLHDHIIIAGEEFVSLAEKGYV